MAEYDRLNDSDGFLANKTIYGVIIGPSDHQKQLSYYAHRMLEPLIGNDLTFHSIHEIDDYEDYDNGETKHIMLFSALCITEGPVPLAGLVIRDGKYRLQIVDMLQVVLDAIKDYV